MSLARAFTTRRNKAGMVDSSNPARAQSTRKPINRNDISLPVNLISTTNMLSYNAPDISSLRHASSGSSASSSHSSTDSDAKSTSSAHDTVLTDASSVGSSPTSPKPNHLSSYFEQATNGKAPQKSSPTSPVPTVPAQSPRRSRSITNMQQRATLEEKKPNIPQRALSHSKSAHEHLARQRSLRNSSSSPRLSQSRDIRSSADIFKVNEDPNHPFGKELEQLQEVVEEFGGVVTEAANDEDYSFMVAGGLTKFSAADYMSEIQPLYAGIFHKQVIAVQSGWI